RPASRTWPWSLTIRARWNGRLCRGDPQCGAPEHLEELLAAGADVSGVIAACLGPPLYATRFHEGFGTLYTAEYRPAEGGVSYHWPGQSWRQSLDNFQAGSLQIQLRAR